MNRDFSEILESIDNFSPEERTDLLCGIIDHCCLEPCELYPLLGIEAKTVDELANRHEDYFGSVFFHQEQLDLIPTEVIRQYVEKFHIENQ